MIEYLKWLNFFSVKKVINIAKIKLKKLIIFMNSKWTF
jgi:hypothetical protein